MSASPAQQALQRVLGMRAGIYWQGSCVVALGSTTKTSNDKRLYYIWCRNPERAL